MSGNPQPAPSPTSRTSPSPPRCRTPPAKREPKRDALGRSYATGRRKNAVARVWIKPGKGEITGQRQARRRSISPARCCAC